MVPPTRGADSDAIMQGKTSSDQCQCYTVPQDEIMSVKTASNPIGGTFLQPHTFNCPQYASSTMR